MADTPIMIKAGTRLWSTVCSTVMITVKAPVEPIDVTIGGAPAAAEEMGAASGNDVVDGHGGGSLIGKRYVNTAGTLELLCISAGEGLPAVDGEVLHTKGATALPASD